MVGAGIASAYYGGYRGYYGGYSGGGYPQYSYPSASYYGYGGGYGGGGGGYVYGGGYSYVDDSCMPSGPYSGYSSRPAER